MFDALNKRFQEVQERDEERIHRRKSKRLTLTYDTSKRLTDLNPDGETDLDGIRITTNGTPARSASFESFEEDEDDLLEGRPKWDNDYMLILFMIGYTVGLSNVWRFGYLCKEHGGAAFLIPYFFFTIVCAFPCLYLELLVGQYAQVGAIACWKLCPLFKGVGLCMTLVTFMSCINIQSVLAWCLFYIFHSTFYDPLPWVSCDNGFGKLQNGLTDMSLGRWDHADEAEEQAKNWHTENCTEFFADAGTDNELNISQRLPGSEYFRGRVQRMWKSGYADSGPNFTETNGVTWFGLDRENYGILEYNKDTAIALLVVFILVELLVSRGIKLNGNVMLVFVVCPYFILTLLFYRATGLSGAWDGLYELFKPDFSKLGEYETWWKCAEQVFYSTGAGFGVHLTSASFNPFDRRIVYDAVFLVTINSFTSILSACTIFMFLGHVHVAVNRDIESFVRSGPELVFEVMSDVLGVLAKANFYAFCFYVLLFFMGITTVTASFICAKSAYLEILPISLKYKSSVRVLILAVLSGANFAVSSLNLTRGGLHTYNFIGTFVGLYALILTAFLFLIGITWIFGLREVIEATHVMGIRTPGIFYQICWKFICPMTILWVFFGLAFDSGSHIVKYDNRVVQIGIFLYIVGYSIALGPFLAVFSGAFHALWKAPGKNFKEKLLTCLSPSQEHKEILATGTGKRANASHYLYVFVPTHNNAVNLCCSFSHKRKVAPENNLPTILHFGSYTTPKGKQVVINDNISIVSEDTKENRAEYPAETPTPKIPIVGMSDPEPATKKPDEKLTQLQPVENVRENPTESTDSAGEQRPNINSKNSDSKSQKVSQAKKSHLNKDVMCSIQ